MEQVLGRSIFHQLKPLPVSLVNPVVLSLPLFEEVFGSPQLTLSLANEMKILKGYDEVFNNEAIRVLKSVNDWEFLYKHGKPFHRTWILPVCFYKRFSK